MPTITIPLVLDEIQDRALTAYAAERGETVPSLLRAGVEDVLAKAQARYAEKLQTRVVDAYQRGSTQKRLALVTALESIEQES